MACFFCFWRGLTLKVVSYLTQLCCIYCLTLDGNLNKYQFNLQQINERSIHVLFLFASTLMQNSIFVPSSIILCRQWGESVKGFVTSRGPLHGIWNLRNMSSEKMVGTYPKITPISSCFKSITCRDVEGKIWESQVLRQLVKVFVLDIETTGFCREKGRVIEIALRDLIGGENSCFQTLVNPERDVPNSYIHGITGDMVNRPHVPRMKELIPILIQYTKARQIPGAPALFVAHNGRCFDVPFLVKEFSRCSIEIPDNWLFLDTLPLARELMKLKGPKVSSRISVQALREYYDIPLDGDAHRAMSDVNLLTSILERMTFDMKLSITDLLERSFRASDLVHSKKKNNNKKL